MPYDDNLDVETWFDLGLNDSTAIWFVQRFKGEIRLIDYYENSGYGLDHYADILDQKGYEYKFGHCWLPRDLENLFSFMKYKSKLKGKYNKKYSLEEKVERNSRADPFDGLRPLIKLRKKL